MSLHIIAGGSSMDTLSCSVCGRMCKTRQGLVAHRRVCGRGAISTTCDRCQAVYSQVSSLRRHQAKCLQSVHTTPAAASSHNESLEKKVRVMEQQIATLMAAQRDTHSPGPSQSIHLSGESIAINTFVNAPIYIVPHNYYDVKVDLSHVFEEGAIIKGRDAGLSQGVFHRVLRALWFNPSDPKNCSVKLLKKEPLALRIMDGVWRDVTDPDEVKHQVSKLVFRATVLAEPFRPGWDDFKDDNAKHILRLYSGDAQTPDSRQYLEEIFVEVLCESEPLCRPTRPPQEPTL